jgi:hypothetical protein
MTDAAPEPEGPTAAEEAETSAAPPVRRRPVARWLLRQFLFWLLVVLIPVVIWRIVTWPVGLPHR